MLRVRKTESDAGLVDRQLAFFGVAPDVSPKNVTRVNDFTYEYDFVVGQSMPDPRAMWAVAVTFLWGASPSLDPVSEYSKLRYIAYVKRRLENSSHDGPLSLAERVEAAMRTHLLPANLTPARITHGDMTLENAILSQDGEIIFIDPGNGRGLWCRELDEAKICQSLAGWETAKYGARVHLWANDDDMPFPITNAHRVLELSHWARLIAHPEKHNSRSMQFAITRAETLLGILE